MTKQDYMNQLEKALEKCTPEFRSEILTDYEEYFRGGLMGGKTEEEICIQLGTIEDFVKEIPVECYADTIAANATFSKANNTAEVNAPECQNTSDTEPTSVPQKVSALAEISKVIIYAGSADAQIYHSDNADIKIDAEGRYDIRYEGTECTITLLPSEPHTFMGLFTVQSGSSADIYVPCSVKSLEVHAVSGDIEIEDLQLDELQCSTGSGDQSLSHLVVKAMAATSVSGDIDIDSSHIDGMTIQSTSGDQEVTDSQIQTAAFKSASGDITCQNVQLRAINASCSSGDIEISNDVSCSASLGTSSGDITYFDRTGQGYQCKVRTRSGDYTLYFDNEELASGSGQNTLSCGSGTSVLEVSTSSGDIEING